MPARAFVIRFPDGDFEYDLTRSVPPSVGETLRRRGVSWCVTERTQEDVLTLHVERAQRRPGREYLSARPRTMRVSESDAVRKVKNEIVLRRLNERIEEQKTT